MKKAEELKEMLCEELEAIASTGNISRSDLDDVSKLTESLKNLYKIEMLEEASEYSQDGEWEARGNYARGNMRSNRNYSYDDDMDNMNRNSYARRRGTHYVRGHYSRADVSERLDSMMNNSRLTEEERDTLERAMDMLGK